MATNASKTSKAGSTKTTRTAAAATKTAAKPGAKAGTAKVVAKPAKAAAAKAVSKPAPAKAAKRPVVTPEQRRWYVEVAAYYIAERRGFSGGSATEDWLRAEAEVERLLAEGLINP